MELLVIWLVFAVIVGVAAQGKGRSAIGWALLSILISPLLALILLVVVGDAKPNAAAVGAWVTTGGGSVADEIAKLASLRDSGALTLAEFERQKAALLVPAARPVKNAVPAAWGQKD